MGASDIIVVGAGIVGCAVAYELARRGAGVAVIDHRGVGLGATQASAGMLTPYLEAEDDSPLLDLAAGSLDLYDQFVAGVADTSGLPIGFSRGGSLEVARDAAALQRLTDMRDALARRGVAAQLFDAADTRRHEPALTASVMGSLLIPSHGFVDAGQLVRALAAAGERHGVRFMRAARAARIDAGGTGLVLATEQGRVAAGVIVLAAGSWAGQVQLDAVDACLPIRPVRGQLLRLGWQGPVLRRVVWGPRCYLVPWDDGTLLVGATVEEAGFDERNTVAGIRGLMEAACDLVPAAGDASFREARVGFRPATPDLLPVIGRSTVVPNLVYATGHYRSGVLLSPITAALVADIVLENRVDPRLSAMAPERFGRF